MVKNLLKYHLSTKSYLILKFRNVVKFYVHIRPIFSCRVTYVPITVHESVTVAFSMQCLCCVIIHCYVSSVLSCTQCLCCTQNLMLKINDVGLLWCISFQYQNHRKKHWLLFEHRVPYEKMT